MNKLLLYTLIHLFIPYLKAQNFIDQIKGARIDALAGTGLALKSLTGISRNIANISSLENTSFELQTESRFIGLGISGVSLVGGIPLHHNAIGFGVEEYGLEDFHQQQYKIGYARSLSKHLSIGAAYDYILFNIATKENISIHSLHLGCLYELANLRFGLSFFKPMVPIHMRPYQPQHIIAYGVQYTVSSNVSLLVEGESDDLSSKTAFRAGLEYQLLPILMMRIGIGTHPYLFAAGLGIKINDRFGIDLGSSFYQYIGTTPSMSLHYNFQQNKIEE